MSAEGEPTAYSVPEAFSSVTLIHSSKAKKKMKKRQDRKLAMVPAATIPAITKEDALASSLINSVMTGGFMDTAFTVYMRRGARGAVNSPQLVYANGAVLRSVSGYFSTRASAPII